MSSPTAPKPTILIVDDEEDVRYSLTELLRDDYGTLEAKDGLEALDVIRQKGTEIDVVLLDIRMPALDGEQVLMKAKEIIDIERELSFIMVTAFDDVKKAFQFTSYHWGAYDYITKPYRNEDILQAISKALQRRQKKWGDRKHVMGPTQL